MHTNVNLIAYTRIIQIESSIKDWKKGTERFNYLEII